MWCFGTYYYYSFNDVFFSLLLGDQMGIERLKLAFDKKNLMIGKIFRWNIFCEHRHMRQLFPWSWACQKLCLILILPLWHPLHWVRWSLAMGHAREFACVNMVLAPFASTLVSSKVVNVLLTSHPPNMESPFWIPCRTLARFGIWTFHGFF
jgi:hypothetical protein